MSVIVIHNLYRPLLPLRIVSFYNILKNSIQWIPTPVQITAARCQGWGAIIKRKPTLSIDCDSKTRKNYGAGIRDEVKSFDKNNRAKLNEIFYLQYVST